MKYRDYKEFRKNNYYHVYNRGVNKDMIFVNDADFRVFINTIKDILGYSERNNTKSLPFDSFEILTYCLMPNHFHLIIKQCANISISKLMLKLCTSYVRYFNKKYSRIGPMFQDTFKAKIIENDEYLIPLSAYIHNNPKDPITYPYSSIGEYLDIFNKFKICNTKHILDQFNSRQDYLEYMLDQKLSRVTLDNFK